MLIFASIDSWFIDRRLYKEWYNKNKVYWKWKIYTKFLPHTDIFIIILYYLSIIFLQPFSLQFMTN